MFNQLTPADTVKAIGATTQRIARGGGATSEFDRDQLMSTYSATRHLAVELSSYEPELRPVQAGAGGADSPGPAQGSGRRAGSDR